MMRRKSSFIVNTFNIIKDVIHKIMDDMGEDKNLYVVYIHPFSIGRIDGKPVPKQLMRNIQIKFSTLYM